MGAQIMEAHQNGRFNHNDIIGTMTMQAHAAHCVRFGEKKIPLRQRKR